mmetsp:Transcript_1382/g.1684  ORF Transcript_1382/g.1684 Transcript_1382/m.1684 type:complete len:417 (+) Transcript_1382:63-1313(+)
MLLPKQWSLKLVLPFLVISVVQAKTILTYLNGSNLTVLNAAVNAASPGVRSIFNTTSTELTLFAPDDSAFNSTDQAYIADLVSGEYEPQVDCFLLFHSLTFKIKSQDVIGSINIVDVAGEVRFLSKVNDTFGVNGVAVTTPDISAQNGIIHVISDAPLLPECVTTTIYEEATNIDSISIFLYLLSKAGYTDMLNSSRPLTLLAPTNDAFQQDILDILLFNDTALNETVTNHLIPNNVYLSPTINMDELFTIQSESVTFEYDGNETYTVNNGTITLENSVASNGMLHVIDTVLLPESLGLINCGDFKVKNGYYLCGPRTACVAGRTSCTIAVTGDACVCACLPGKEGPTCLDIDECMQDPPICPENGFCVDYDTPEKYKCGCKDNFTPVLAHNESQIEELYGSIEPVPKEWRPLACV